MVLHAKAKSKKSLYLLRNSAKFKGKCKFDPESVGFKEKL